MGKSQKSVDWTSKVEVWAPGETGRVAYVDYPDSYAFCKFEEVDKYCTCICHLCTLDGGWTPRDGCCNLPCPALHVCRPAAVIRDNRRRQV